VADARPARGRRRGLRPDDLLRYAWLEAVALDPGARSVAHVLTRIAAGGAYQSDVDLLDLGGGPARRLTAGAGRAGPPVWSRDGRRLAFVWQPAETGAPWALVVVDAAGGGRLELTDAAAGPPTAGPPTALDWSPDGERLACVRWTVADPPPPARPGLPPATARTVRRLRYKQDGAGWVHDRYRQIWVVDLATASWTQRTFAELDHGEPRWSWAGTRIACTAVAREQDEPLGYGQLLILDEARDEVVAPLAAWPGLAASPAWRHDDGAIAFAGHDHPPPVHRRRFAHVWLLDLATGACRDLTAGVDAQVGNYAVSDMRPGLTSVAVAWPEGRGDLWCLLTREGAVHLHRIDAAAATTVEVVGGEGVVFAFSAAADGTVAYGWSDPGVVGDLHLCDAGGGGRRLRAFNRWLEDVAVARPEAHDYAAPGGARVHGWELRPPDFDPALQYPAIAYVHCSMFSWAFSHEFQCLAAAGHVVQYLNQFGTTAGYGQAHALGNYVGSQRRESAEILAAVDALAARPYVDGARIGITGGSCGGYLTNWLIGQSDRFAAAVAQRSISNLVSKFGTGDNGPEQATAEGARPPWADVETLWRNSPIAYAPRVTTPLLILHSTEDHRCPLSQAEEWFAALRWHGATVELVVFEGESHELSRAGRPQHRIERLTRILDWFRRHLGPPRAAVDDRGAA
jgi:dipeptidyl aminopeptidase/acylaminoacyl peptidase